MLLPAIVYTIIIIQNAPVVMLLLATYISGKVELTDRLVAFARHLLDNLE